MTRATPISKKLVFVLFATLVVTGVSGRPASSIDHGSMGVMGPEDTSKTKTHLREEFPPLAGIYTSNSEAPQPYSLFNSWGCANLSYCNRHVFEVLAPVGYIESMKGTDIVSYGVKVTLTWDNHQENDLDLFVGWALEDPASGAPGGPCTAPEDAECQKLYPESFAVIEPMPVDDDESTEDVDETKEPAPVYISVVNDDGVNTGYTLDAQWFLIPFGSFEEFKPPKNRSVSRPVTASRTPLPAQAPAGGDRSSAADGPDPETKILIPGPDGELIEQSLDFLSAGNRLKTEKSGTAPWVWIVTAAVSGIAVLLFVYFVWQRRRREAL